MSLMSTQILANAAHVQYTITDNDMLRPFWKFGESKWLLTYHVNNLIWH